MAYIRDLTVCGKYPFVYQHKNSIGMRYVFRCLDTTYLVIGLCIYNGHIWTRRYYACQYG